MNIYPTILTDSLDEYRQQFLLAQLLEGVDVIQVDIIDGHFADNLTITPTDLSCEEFGEMKLDFHLMVEEPMDFLNEIIEYQEYLPVRAVLGHIERMSNQQEFIEVARDQKYLTGFSLNLFTPLEEINTELYSQLNIIQLMTVEAGYQGQEFHQSAYQKITQLAQIKKDNHYEFELLVDGGVKAENINLLHQAGAQAVAVGSWLWKNSNPASVVTQVINM